MPHPHPLPHEPTTDNRQPIPHTHTQSPHHSSTVLRFYNSTLLPAHYFFSKIFPPRELSTPAGWLKRHIDSTSTKFYRHVTQSQFRLLRPAPVYSQWLREGKLAQRKSSQGLRPGRLRRKMLEPISKPPQGLQAGLFCLSCVAKKVT